MKREVTFSEVVYDNYKSVFSPSALSLKKKKKKKRIKDETKNNGQLLKNVKQ